MYGVIAGKPLDDALTITFIIDLCVNDVKDRLELATKDTPYSKVRGDIMSVSERPKHLRRCSPHGCGQPKGRALDPLSDQRVGGGAKSTTRMTRSSIGTRKGSGRNRAARRSLRCSPKGENKGVWPKGQAVLGKRGGNMG